MSEEQLKAFLAKVQADNSLQEQLKAEGADPVAIAKAAGFVITKEDLKSHRQTLSEDELEGVAGGGVGGWKTKNLECIWEWQRLKTAYTLKALALAGAFYFINDFHIHWKRHPIPGTIDLQKVPLMSYSAGANQQ